MILSPVVAAEQMKPSFQGYARNKVDERTAESDPWQGCGKDLGSAQMLIEQCAAAVTMDIVGRG